MIRSAKLTDIDEVEKSYTELLLYEKENGAYTVWQLGVYPTRQTAENALSSGSLYVMEQSGEIYASMIVNQTSPEEYGNIQWKCRALSSEVLVLHLLCVRPSKLGQGIGQEMVRFAAEECKRRHCKTLRLDTGKQNIPAVSLYKKLGFELAGTAPMCIGGKIAHNDHLFFEKTITGEDNENFSH